MNPAFKDVLQTIRRYFSERNKAWLTGDVTQLVRSYRMNVATPSVREVLLYHSAAGRRGIRCEKARTRIWVEGVQFSREGNAITVNLTEQVHWIYDDHAQYSYEARKTPRRLVLRKRGRDWAIARDIPREDGRDPLSADQDIRQGRQAQHIHFERSGRITYDRVKAYKYAELWWNSYNPQFKTFALDCTNYVSQVLFAGGVRMEHTGNANKGWWYEWNHGGNDKCSVSWSVAHSLYWYLAERSDRAAFVDSPQDLKVGDIIMYDFNGDGRWNHSTVVVDFDQSGMPLVNAHTVSSHRRYWDYRDSPAWSQNVRYRLVHMHDVL